MVTSKTAEIPLGNTLTSLFLYSDIERRKDQFHSNGINRKKREWKLLRREVARGNSVSNNPGGVISQRQVEFGDYINVSCRNEKNHRPSNTIAPLLSKTEIHRLTHKSLITTYNYFSSENNRNNDNMKCFKSGGTREYKTDYYERKGGGEKDILNQDSGKLVGISQLKFAYEYKDSVLNEIQLFLKDRSSNFQNLSKKMNIYEGEGEISTEPIDINTEKQTHCDSIVNSKNKVYLQSLVECGQNLNSAPKLSEVYEFSGGSKNLPVRNHMNLPISDQTTFESEGQQENIMFSEIRFSREKINNKYKRTVKDDYHKKRKKQIKRGRHRYFHRKKSTGFSIDKCVSNTEQSIKDSIYFPNLNTKGNLKLPKETFIKDKDPSESLNGFDFEGNEKVNKLYVKCKLDANHSMDEECISSRTRFECESNIRLEDCRHVPSNNNIAQMRANKPHLLLIKSLSDPCVLFWRKHTKFSVIKYTQNKLNLFIRNCLNSKKILVDTKNNAAENFCKKVRCSKGLSRLHKHKRREDKSKRTLVADECFMDPDIKKRSLAVVGGIEDKVERRRGVEKNDAERGYLIPLLPRPQMSSQSIYLCKGDYNTKYFQEEAEKDYLPEEQSCFPDPQLCYSEHTFIEGDSRDIQKCRKKDKKRPAKKLLCQHLTLIGEGEGGDKGMRQTFKKDFNMRGRAGKKEEKIISNTPEGQSLPQQPACPQSLNTHLISATTPFSTVKQLNGIPVPPLKKINVEYDDFNPRIKLPEEVYQCPSASKECVPLRHVRKVKNNYCSSTISISLENCNADKNANESKCESSESFLKYNKIPGSTEKVENNSHLILGNFLSVEKSETKEEMRIPKLLEQQKPHKIHKMKESEGLSETRDVALSAIHSSELLQPYRQTKKETSDKAVMCDNLFPNKIFYENDYLSTNRLEEINENQKNKHAKEAVPVFNEAGKKEWKLKNKDSRMGTAVGRTDFSDRASYPIGEDGIAIHKGISMSEDHMKDVKIKFQKSFYVVYNKDSELGVQSKSLWSSLVSGSSRVFNLLINSRKNTV